MTRREFRDLSPPDEAREALESLDVGGGVESVPLVDAESRTLAERVDATIDVPGFARAAMDGYAVRASDTFGASESDPVPLPVVGTVHAGSEPDCTVGEGEAVQVATGAVMPDGADAVVPVERTVENENGVDITAAVAPGDSVMFRGADIAAGDRALGPGTHLGPRHIGLLAALGRETAPVRAEPTVGVVSTGEELVQPGSDLDAGAGQIYDVNSHSVAGAVEAAGGEAVRYTPATDDEETLRAALREAAAETDLLLTSGSTSAGEADLLYRLVEEEGEILVHGVALKPGRPMLVGRVFGTPYVGLPGYPVSALSVFRTFVTPRLREASGRPEATTPTVDATLATRVRYEGGRLRLVAVGLITDGDGTLAAYAPAKGSGATTTLAETDGVVRMDPETTLMPVGSSVTVERFDDTPVPTLLGVGDPDPAVASLFDDLDATRYLPLGPADARRWLEDSIPDVLVADQSVLDDDTDGEALAFWAREWGLVVPEGNPAGLSGVEDLVEADCHFANLDDSLTLRTALGDRLVTLAIDPADIDGYHRELPGIESAARSVAAGRADVGLGLRTTADALGLEFVPVGTQRLTLLCNPRRTGKDSIDRLCALLDERLADLLAETPGYEALEY
jgi:molybdenum cofactor synthesis domain-containing protein